MYEITTLGQEIRTYRKINGLDQAQLAWNLGVDRTTVSSWERNISLPRPKQIRKLISNGIVTKMRARDLIARAQTGYPVGKFMFEILITPPKDLVASGVRFALNFSRPGPNSTDIWERPSINLEIDFQRLSTRGSPAMVAQVRRPDRMGFQFKCFAEFNDLDWRHVRQELKTAGFSPDEYPGAGQFQRLWFLLRDEEQIQGPEGIVDNFFYPS
jgi:transcriptional regulator with XRE-family HTH domain